MEDKSYRLGPMAGAVGISILHLTLRVVSMNTLLHIPAPIGPVLHFYVFSLMMFFLTKWFGRMGGLSLTDMRIIPIRVPLTAVALGLTLPFFVLTLHALFLPGHFVAGNLSASEITAVVCEALLISGFCSGISEELIFRGYILSAFEQKYGRLRALLFSSVIFMLVHIGSSLQRYLIVGLFGCLMSIAILRSGSVWTGVFIHSFNNALQRLFAICLPTDDAAPPLRLFYYVVSGDYTEQANRLSEMTPYLCMALSATLIAALWLIMPRTKTAKECR